MRRGDPRVISHLQAQLKNDSRPSTNFSCTTALLKRGLPGQESWRRRIRKIDWRMKHADKLMDRIFMLLGRPAQPARPRQAQRR